MRLLSLTVRNYRAHKDLTVNFDPSRTVIGGPNESGKSTLAEAAHRSLFLRAKTGGSVQKEMVSTRHNGDPEVLLTFEAGGARWELEKHFAGASRGSTRLTAQGGAALRDDEAESKLAELLKSDIAGGRTAAGVLPDLWSHLWVWQGRSGEEPSAHSAQHKEGLVRHLQHHSVAAVLQSATDQRVASRIAEFHQELYTTNGKSKAGSKPDLARTRLEEAAVALDHARGAADRLAQAADTYAHAEREIDELTVLLPKLREDRITTETKLRGVEALRRDETTQAQDVQNATARCEELESHDRKIRDLQARMLKESSALQPTEAKIATLTEAERSARAASQAADATLKTNTDTVRHARLHHDLATAAVAAFEKTEAHQAITARATEAAALQDDLSVLRAELAKLPVLDARDLARLRKLETAVTKKSAALEAIATGVELIESALPVRLDGETLGSGETRILTHSGELQVGDSTRLRIRPGGGSSLADARQEADAAREALAGALQQLALGDLEHAATAFGKRQTLEPQIAGIEARWKTLGGADLATDLAHAAADRDAAREDFHRRITLAAAVNSPITPPADLASARDLAGTTRDALAAAESAEATAQRQSEHLRKKLESAGNHLAQHRDAAAAARQDLRDLETVIKTREESHGDATARAQAIAAARDATTLATTTLTSTRNALAALNPDLLAADFERFTRALATQESRLREAENTRLVARDRLSLDGTSDPEADLRFAEARHTAAQAAHASELRRAMAIETLHQLFNASREAIDRALVQPLAERIAGYLQCLFGAGTEARIQLSDGGIESLELIRPGDPAFSFATLSGGAREQVGAAVRLALGEILAADHDGCLPILFDDAFAYSDPDRIQSLQRMLDLAALRGLQIVVLTSTPGAYSAFGALPIDITKDR